jgi:hypothetical protein
MTELAYRYNSILQKTIKATYIHYYVRFIYKHVTQHVHVTHHSSNYRGVARLTIIVVTISITIIEICLN